MPLNSSVLPYVLLVMRVVLTFQTFFDASWMMVNLAELAIFGGARVIVINCVLVHEVMAEMCCAYILGSDRGESGLCPEKVKCVHISAS